MTPPCVWPGVRVCGCASVRATQFASVEDCFAALDEDGSGTLNRRELAVGLAKARMPFVHNSLLEQRIRVPQST